MTLTDTPATVTAAPAPARPRSRRWIGWTAGVSTVAAAAVGIFALTVPSAPSAAAAVRSAAAKTATVTSLRAEVTIAGEAPATGEFAGADVRIVDQGDVETQVGGWTYTSTPDGKVTNKTRTTEADQLSPFAASAAHVVQATMTGSGPSGGDKETVRGIKTTHYRLSLTDASRRALNALPAGERAWFDLESVDSTTAVDVWIADDLIRRIKVTADRTSTTEFWDFGASITITAPKG